MHARMCRHPVFALMSLCNSCRHHKDLCSEACRVQVTKNCTLPYVPGHDYANGDCVETVAAWAALGFDFVCMRVSGFGLSSFGFGEKGGKGEGCGSQSVILRGSTFTDSAQLLLQCLKIALGFRTLKVQVIPSDILMLHTPTP